MVHGLETEYEDRINFVYLDTDDPAVAPFREQLGLVSVPHFFLLDHDGTVVKDWVGPMPRYEFTNSFDRLLTAR